jgi:U3 small nucleolar RNA-associated protein 21
MDSIIRVWDLPLGLMVDAFRVSSPCVSLTFSPTGEFLATAHSDELGIYLWANVSLYSSITLRPLPHNFEPTLLSLPRVRSDGEEEEEMDINEDLIYISPQQLSEDLITLSTLPHSRWKNLLNLDLIKVIIVDLLLILIHNIFIDHIIIFTEKE